MSNHCSMCGKRLREPISVSIGIGPVCRMKIKIKELKMGNNLFSNRSLYDFKFDDDIVCIEDLNGMKSVTNDMDNILEDLNKQIPGLERKKVIYKDSFGVWDEVRFKISSCHIHSITFHPIGEKEVNKALEIIKSR